MDGLEIFSPMNFDARVLSKIKAAGFVGWMTIAGAAEVLAATPKCTVDQQPVQIEHNIFEPGHPPPVLTRSPGIEAAFCGTRFGCVCGVMAETPKFTFGLAAAKITSVTVTTQAHITIWTPEGGRPEYLAHEETHRAISEHYYRGAGEVATRLANKLLGTKISLPGRNAKQRLDDALVEYRDQLIADFMHEIAERNDFAQDRFDTITNHGLESIPNQQAMAQAIADEEAHWKTMPH